MPFFEKMHKEIERALDKNFKVKSLHEGYGLLAEEVAELFDEVRKKRKAVDYKNMRLECAQIGAICCRISVDCEEPKDD